MAKREPGEWRGSDEMVAAANAAQLEMTKFFSKLNAQERNGVAKYYAFLKSHNMAGYKNLLDMTPTALEFGARTPTDPSEFDMAEGATPDREE